MTLLLSGLVHICRYVLFHSAIAVWLKTPFLVSEKHTHFIRGFVHYSTRQYHGRSGSRFVQFTLGDFVCSLENCFIGLLQVHFPLLPRWHWPWAISGSYVTGSLVSRRQEGMSAAHQFWYIVAEDFMGGHGFGMCGHYGIDSDLVLAVLSVSPTCGVAGSCRKHKPGGLFRCTPFVVHSGRACSWGSTTSAWAVTTA